MKIVKYLILEEETLDVTDRSDLEIALIRSLHEESILIEELQLEVEKENA